MLIANVQFLRFLAAFAVVVYHVNFAQFGIHTEFGAVTVFFCISGFIVTLVTRDDRGGEAFLKRRLIRILPLYWMLTAAYYLLKTLPGGRAALATFPQEVDELLMSFFFIPYENYAGHVQPILNVGWTLNLEIYFYLIFAASLLISRRFAPIIAASAIVALWGMIKLLDLTPALEFYGGDHVLYFALGIAVFYVWKGIRRSALITGAACATVALYPFLIVFGAYGLVWIMPPLLLLAVLVLEDRGVAIRSRILMMLGAASYALYLSHFLVLVGWRILMGLYSLPAFESDWRAALLVSTASLSLGVILHLLVEQPVTQALKAYSQRRRAKPVPRPA